MNLHFYLVVIVALNPSGWLKAVSLTCLVSRNERDVRNDPAISLSQLVTNNNIHQTDTMKHTITDRIN